jgi:hypothetical protein
MWTRTTVSVTKGVGVQALGGLVFDSDGMELEKLRDSVGTRGDVDRDTIRATRRSERDVFIVGVWEMRGIAERKLKGRGEEVRR